MITLDNFYMSTRANFKGCKKPKRKPNYVSKDRDGNTSSMYWYGEDSYGKYVIRYSNHWCNITNFNKDHYRDCKRISTCQWSIKTNNHEHWKAGKCYLSDFKSL